MFVNTEIGYYTACKQTGELEWTTGIRGSVFGFIFFLVKFHWLKSSPQMVEIFKISIGIYYSQLTLTINHDQLMTCIVLYKYYIIENTR